jgi:beta-glucosidase
MRSRARTVLVTRVEHAAHERSRFVEDLLSYMTLEEKLGQLDLFHSPDDPALEAAVASGRVGGVAGAFFPARLQALATERSRLGIPLLLARGAFELPLSPWPLAASWDEDLLRSVGAACAREAIRDGFNCLRGPAIGELLEDGRTASQISVSEPYLAARLAAAFAHGAMGDGTDHSAAVLSVPVGASASEADDLSWSLALVHDGGVAAIDCDALDRITAQRAGFSGILVGECKRIASLISRQYASTSARSMLEAAERMIEDGLLNELDIDMAVRGVLGAKHGLGLFRDPQRMVAHGASGPSSGTDCERVRASFILLRNEAGLLPLSPVSDRVLVVGAADGAGAACADALTRAGIGHSVAPGLAQRRTGESWSAPVAGDHLALSLSSDAARRADFVLVALDDRHFTAGAERGWRRPTQSVLTMLRGLSLAGTRMFAVVATPDPVDLSEADQYFAAALQCWEPRAGFEEALSDVLSGRFSPQGRMPASVGRFLLGHGMGFGESVLSGYSLSMRGDHVVAAVKVRNSGTFPLRETVQVYIRQADGRLRLIAFEHALLAPGQEASLDFALGVEALGVQGSDKRLALAPGRREILVGKSMERLLSASIEVSASAARAMTLRESGFLRLAAV